MKYLRSVFLKFRYTLQAERIQVQISRAIIRKLFPFCAFLWQSSDELRGGLDASHYKDYTQKQPRQVCRDPA